MSRRPSGLSDQSSLVQDAYAFAQVVSKEDFVPCSLNICVEHLGEYDDHIYVICSQFVSMFLLSSLVSGDHI